MASGSGSKYPWYPKTLLSFDGGGVRGYSSLLILKALVQEISRIECDNDPQVTSSAHPLEHCTFSPSQHCFSGPVRGLVSASETREGVQRTLDQDPSDSLSRYFVSHYFDYIAGTSTGGWDSSLLSQTKEFFADICVNLRLIAIMLGRLFMTVDECIEAYEKLVPKIFAEPRWLHFENTFLPRYKYDHKTLENSIRNIVESRSGRPDTILQQPNEDMCRIITLAWHEETYDIDRVPLLFRSYHHPAHGYYAERNPSPACLYPIWKVARATSAAPPYFKPIKLEKNGNPLVDGGLGANNPSEEAWYSIRQFHSDDPNAVAVLVSIGTGQYLKKWRTGRRSFFRKMYDHVQTMKAIATGTHEVHKYLQDTMAHKGNYYRLDVPKERGDPEVPLDACKGKGGIDTLNLIRQKTEVYLRSQPARQYIHSSAQRLVDIRKARSNHSDRDRWERFCHGLTYRCTMPGCLDSAEKWVERLELQTHLEQKHASSYSAENLQSLLDAGKTYSIEDSE